MNWGRDKSILLSHICVIFFVVLLLALDIGCYWVVRTHTVQYMGFSDFPFQHQGEQWQYAPFLLASVYLGSALGWVTLWKLWSLLRNIRHGSVFVLANVRCMRVVSWCCFGVAGISFLDALWYLPYVFVVIGAAAAFVGLIVRIVKNAFQQAIAMKDELDLTI